jgi:hypothetical protein
MQKVVVVYDKGVKAAGLADKIIGYIRGAGIETVAFDGVLSDSPDFTINEGAALASKENVDGVVAVGGAVPSTPARASTCSSRTAPHQPVFRAARPAAHGRPDPSETAHRHPDDGGHRQRGLAGRACADTAMGTKENFGAPCRWASSTRNSRWASRRR